MEAISLYSFMTTTLKVVGNWWWVIVPFLLWKPLRLIYRFLIMERWDSKIKKTLIEIKIPQEIEKPMRAMDQMFADFHGIHDIATWRETWIEGVFQLTISCEIVSNGGEIHFYIRTPEMFRNFIESNIYAQYPEAEIKVVDDYTKYVPQNIPNKDWDLWAVDYVNAKDEIYPIKTYKQLETEAERTEEKRIDPMANFLEGLSTLKPGEQFWTQIICKPVLGRDKPWQARGKVLVEKLARRPEKPKAKSIIREAADVLVTGKPPGEEEKPQERDIIPPEMKLTPGEREVLKAIEDKLAKFGYDCNVRFVYLGKRDVFFKPTTKIGFGFFKEISTENLGGLRPTSATMTKVKSVFFWFLDKRRLYLRKRRMLRYYIKRWPPLFPRKGMTYILNTEELATLYHFPGKRVAPAAGVPRVAARKKGAPVELPVEEL